VGDGVGLLDVGDGVGLLDVGDGVGLLEVGDGVGLLDVGDGVGLPEVGDGVGLLEQTPPVHAAPPQSVAVMHCWQVPAPTLHFGVDPLQPVTAEALD